MKHNFYRIFGTLFLIAGSALPQYLYSTDNTCAEQFQVISSLTSGYYNNLSNAQLVGNSHIFFPYMGDAVNLATVAGNPGGQFGSAIAASQDGSIIAVGAKNGGVNGAGVVYIFAQHFASWELVQVLAPSDGVSGNQFGHKIAVSADGSTIVVGAPYAQNNTGRAYIFNRVATNSWMQTQELAAPTETTGIAFGRAIALSYDGRVLIITAPGAELYDTPTKVGYVYSFIRAPNCSQVTPVWNFEQAFSGTTQIPAEFGASLSLNGNGYILAVGAPGFNYTVADEGAVFLYSRHADDSGWNTTQITFITPDPNISGALGSGVKFGSDVALSGDANTLFIGGPGFPANGTTRQGTVFYIDRPIQFPSSQKLLQVLKIPVTYSGLGSSISISHDGRAVLIGTASDSNGGSANYFISSSNANINGRKSPSDTSYLENQNFQPLPQATTFGSVCTLTRDCGYCISADPNYLGAGIVMVYRAIGASVGGDAAHYPIAPKQQSLLPLYALGALLVGYCLTR